MSRFRGFARAILPLLVAAACAPSLASRSTAGPVVSAHTIEGIVDSVSLPGWVFLAEAVTGIGTIEVTGRTRIADSQGNPASLCRLQAGQSIQAAGEIFGRSLRATRITLLDDPGSHEATGPRLRATLDMPALLSNGKTVELTFTLTNDTGGGLYVLKWYTPLEGFGGQILCVQRDGRPVAYKGPEAERADPTPGSYVFLDAGASVPATVDLAMVYDFSKAGAYTIGFSSPRMSHVASTEGEMATSLHDLGPVAMPSNQITVTILEDL